MLIMQNKQGSGTGPNHANVQLLGDSVSHSDFVVGVNVRFYFNTDGTMQERAGSITTIDPWWIPAPEASIGDFYEVKYDTNSGTDADEFGMTAGTWYALTAQRQMGFSRAFAGTTSGNFTVSIRDAATQTVRATGTYTMSVTYLP